MSPLANFVLANNLKVVRNVFHEIKNEDDLDRIILWEGDGLSAQEQEILKAYQGICQSMKAQYYFSPISKLKSFNEGKRRLEESIKQDQGVENTYLRLLLQVSSPKMLGYNTHITEDIDYLKEHLPAYEIDDEMKSRMIESLLSANEGNIDLSKLVMN